MRIRPIKLIFVLPLLLTGIVCVCMSPTTSHAQSDAGNQMQIDQPDLPRNRKPRPAFQVEADPTSQPIPIQEYVPLPRPPTKSSLPPTPKEIAKKQAKVREKQRLIAEGDHQQEILTIVGKGAGFLLVVGIGVYAFTDITRQIRKSKQAALQAEDDEENEWEP
ncbi:MAG: hypothetical protein JWN14_1756 [Chthonomonadales bacterium]|nr:hypothetical protein [Chthonomonadales bacterium]